MLEGSVVCVHVHPEQRTAKLTAQDHKIILMEIENFGYSDNLSAGAPASIISSPSEIQQGFEEFSENTAITPCASCGSSRVNLVKMPDYCTHHTARRCGTCDTFLDWQPKPATKEHQKQRRATIERLLKSSQLNQWERSFLEGLKSRKLSPKQTECLAKIESRFGGAA